MIIDSSKNGMWIIQFKKLSGLRVKKVSCIFYACYNRVEAFYKETVSRFRESANMLVNRMVVELESGGNVRFEEGSPSDLWYNIKLLFLHC